MRRLAVRLPIGEREHGPARAGGDRESEQQPQRDDADTRSGHTLNTVASSFSAKSAIGYLNNRSGSSGRTAAPANISSSRWLAGNIRIVVTRSMLEPRSARAC